MLKIYKFLTDSVKRYALLNYEYLKLFFQLYYIAVQIERL